MEKLVLSICDKLNEMYSQDYDGNEKMVEVYNLIKDDITEIANHRESFFTMFSEMVEKNCNEKINDDYGFYEGMIVILCNGI